MLVLSRGQNDRVVFPTLGITVEILRIAGTRVRVGIDAPREIPVLRHEVESNRQPPGSIARTTCETSDVTDALLRRLQQATAGLHCVQQILESGKTDDVEPAVFKILNELRAIEDEVSPTHIRTLFSTKLGQTCRALVVDDDANETELLAGFLRLSGFEVNTAMDGLQAMVQLSKHERPDVVLLDMNMPRFDGGKTVSAIRQNPTYKSLRIFAVSGANQEDTKVSIGPRGVNRWFTKPVNPQSLVEAIHHELAHDCAAV